MNQVAAAFLPLWLTGILILILLGILFCLLLLFLLLACGIPGLRIWGISRRWWLLLRLTAIVSLRPRLLLILAVIASC
jgi:hypothetical protein